MFCKANYAESNNLKPDDVIRRYWGLKKLMFFFGNFDSALLVKKKVLKVESEIYSYLK